MTTTSQTEQAGRAGAVTQQLIPTAAIVADPHQPRQHFDPVALAELAESMRTLGQLQSVTVRYDQATDQYVLIMGERRWRAAQMIGLTEMHALIRDEAVGGATFARSVAENVARADMTPMEEAHAFDRLTRDGYTVEAIAKMCGRAPEGVQYRIDLLGLTDPAREALEKGHLPLGVAWYVCRLTPDSQLTFLGKWTRGEFATIADAEAFAQACRNAAAQADLFAMAEMSHEQRRAVISKRRAVVAKVDRLATAGEILSELARMSPTELAQLLAATPGGVAGYQLRIEHLAAAAGRARATLRKAAAIVAVHAPVLDGFDDEDVA